jgi:hypothetical protein
MRPAVSHVEMDVPARQPRVGELNGATTLSAIPPPITGVVMARGVPGRATTGLPALLMPWTVVARGRTSRRAVGRPGVVSTGGNVPWVVMAKGLGRRNA